MGRSSSQRRWRAGGGAGVNGSRLLAHLPPTEPWRAQAPGEGTGSVPSAGASEPTRVSRVAPLWPPRGLRDHRRIASRSQVSYSGVLCSIPVAGRVLADLRWGAAEPAAHRAGEGARLREARQVGDRLDRRRSPLEVVARGLAAHVVEQSAKARPLLPEPALKASGAHAEPSRYRGNVPGLGLELLSERLPHAPRDVRVASAGEEHLAELLVSVRHRRVGVQRRAREGP